METAKTEHGVLEHWTPEEIKAAFERNEQDNRPGPGRWAPD